MDRKSKAPIDHLLVGKAFRKVFGTALKELGYVNVKGNPCCLVRPVSDEIIHILTARHIYSTVPEHYVFDIYGAVATVYRRELKLTPNFLAKDNFCWFINCVKVVTEADGYTDSEMERECVRAVARFPYRDKETVMSAMENALLAAKDIILPEMNDATDLRSCIRFFIRYAPFTIPNDERLSRWDYDEGLIIPDNYYEDDFRENHDRKLAKDIAEIRKSYEERELDYWKVLLELDTSYHVPKVLTDTQSDSELMNEIHTEMQRRKKLNTERLRSYGIEL